MEIAQSNTQLSNDQYKPLTPILVGLLVVYLPTFIFLAMGPWQKQEYAHGPLVLLVVLFLFWKNRRALLGRDSAINRYGYPILGFGLILFVLGRSQDIVIFEVGSLLVVLSGLALLINGKTAIRNYWFPIIFILFLIPLPAFLIDSLTLPLKYQVSTLVDDLLYWAGYPIARDGVVLTIGPYQLLIADACSGLNSMYALSALGVFYCYFRGHRGVLKNALLLTCILPIAFLTNVVRVIFLTLITYYYSDAVGLTFHDAAAFVEWIIALSLLFLADALISRVPSKRFADASVK